MRFRTAIWILPIGLALALAGCGGGGDDEGDATPQGTSSARTASPRAGTSTVRASGTTTAQPNATQPSAGETPASGSPAATRPPAQATTAPPPPPPTGRTYTAAEAQAVLNSSLLTPLDLPASWIVASDTTQDNAAYATAKPAEAPLIERCGRLLARTIANSPPDVAGNYLGGQPVSFFSTATVYATVAGATDCQAESAVRLAQPGALAREFGSVFDNPDAVTIALVPDFPTIGDGSTAVTLTGDVTASGFTVTVTILVVGFRQGNVTGAVGTAAMAAAPNATLVPLARLVADRIGQQID